MYARVLSAVIIWLVGNFSVLLNNANGQTQSQSQSQEILDFAEYRQFSYSQIHMAMEVRISVWWHDQQEAESACKAAFRRIAELEKIFSDYDPRSEINRLTKEGGTSPVQVSDELLEVLLFSQKLHQKSGGAFDPTAGPLIQLWRTARKSQQLPSDPLLQAARQRVGFEKIVIDSDRKTVQCEIEDMQLDFGGIAKGFIGDQVLELLRSHGISIASYQAGGDFVLGDPAPQTEGWSVQLESGKTVRLSNCGIAISGDTVQFVEIQRVRYSHVVDPRNGWAVTNRKSATVVSPKGMWSDALATTGCILDEKDFQALLKEFPKTKGWANVP